MLSLYLEDETRAREGNVTESARSGLRSTADFFDSLRIRGAHPSSRVRPVVFHLYLSARPIRVRFRHSAAVQANPVTSVSVSGPRRSRLRACDARDPWFLLQLTSVTAEQAMS